MSQPVLRAAAFILALAAPALATADTAPAHPQNHHCKMPDGSMDMKKTHKQCTAAKGTWAKDAPADATKTPPPASKDAKGSAAPAPAPKK